MAHLKHTALPLLLLLAAGMHAAGQNVSATATANSSTSGAGGSSPSPSTPGPAPAASAPAANGTAAARSPTSKGNATAAEQPTSPPSNTPSSPPPPSNTSSPAPTASSTSTVPLPPKPDAGGWILGRATYYGAPASFASAYDPTRGNGSFGILSFGSCGYTNMPGGVLPFPAAAVGALPDARPDFPGSCGRCYDIVCEPGLVYGNSGGPIRLVYGTLPNGTRSAGRLIDGDPFRPYLADINARVPDSQGRLFPGNPAEARGEVETVCNKGSPSVRVRIIDSCPCTQVLSESAPGVAKGGETRRQEWCCGPLDHFDLSYDALERLAHPVSGAIMVRYRAVDCDTGSPISRTYVSPVLFSAAHGIQPGWGWNAYDAQSATLQLASTPAPPPEAGGSLSTCVSIAPGGGLTFYCRQCARQGFQPFAGKRALHFWIRSNANSSDPYGSSTPVGQVPPLKLFVMKDEPGKQYCSNELYLGNTTLPDAQAAGGWARFQIPLSDFGCGGSLAPLASLERVDFQNVQPRNALFCVTALELVA